MDWGRERLLNSYSNPHFLLSKNYALIFLVTFFFDFTVLIPHSILPLQPSLLKSDQTFSLFCFVCFHTISYHKIRINHNLSSSKQLADLSLIPNFREFSQIFHLLHRNFHHRMIYTILLEDGKYLVKKLSCSRKKVIEHLENNECEWTDKYGFEECYVKIQECANNVSTEEIMTLIAMDKYGVDNVRGGSYQNIILSRADKSDIREKINCIYGCNRCKLSHFASRCGKPNKKQIKKLSKKRKLELDAEGPNEEIEEYFVIKSRDGLEYVGREYYITDEKGSFVLEIVSHRVEPHTGWILSGDMSEDADSDCDDADAVHIVIEENAIYNINNKLVINSIGYYRQDIGSLTNVEELVDHLGIKEIVYSDLTYMAKVRNNYLLCV